MNHGPLAYAAIAAFVLLALYRRFRRLFGRQLLQPGRLKFRIAIFALAAVLIAMRSLHSSPMAMAGGAGLVIGAALAYVGLRLTRFEKLADGIHYTPNSYIGAGLTALLLGRLVYRFQVIYPAMQAAQQGAAPPLAAFQRSPMTLLIFALLVGYYIAYYTGLLLRHPAVDALPTADQPDGPASPPSGP